MKIPNWIFAECRRLNFIMNDGVPYQWNERVNSAYMIYKLILIDRKRRAATGKEQG